MQIPKHSLLSSVQFLRGPWTKLQWRNQLIKYLRANSQNCLRLPYHHLWVRGSVIWRVVWASLLATLILRIRSNRFVALISTNDRKMIVRKFANTPPGNGTLIGRGEVQFYGTNFWETELRRTKSLPRCFLMLLRRWSDALKPKMIELKSSETCGFI